MPRVVRWLPVVSLLVLGMLGPAHAAPTFQGIVHGAGTATTFTIYGWGQALEGGAADRTLVCGECHFFVTFASTNLVAVQDGRVDVFPPGAYEVREFAGLLTIHREAPGSFFLTLHGNAEVIRR